jgi:hypothetical protein
MHGKTTLIPKYILYHILIKAAETLRMNSYEKLYGSHARLPY